MRQDGSPLIETDRSARTTAGRLEAPSPAALRAARRRLALDMTGIVASVFAFGVIFGLTARAAGFSGVETVVFSTVVFAGASQFAAAGMVAAGFSWPTIVFLTGLVNARHVLYSAALAPWLGDRPRRERALMAHVLTDESFALGLVHFRRLGIPDRPGYWLAAVGGVFVPWNIATLVGYLGGVVSDPRLLGLDIVFPAAMAGMAVGLATGRREVVALGAGAVVAVAAALAVDSPVGIVAGGLLGPAVGLVVPRRDPDVPEADELPADPDAFTRPDRSEDGMLP